MIDTAHLNVYSHSQDFSMLVRLLQVRQASKVRCLRCNAVKGRWNESNEGLSSRMRQVCFHVIQTDE
jgi:hypothetical protein